MVSAGTANSLANLASGSCAAGRIAPSPMRESLSLTGSGSQISRMKTLLVDTRPLPRRAGTADHPRFPGAGAASGRRRHRGAGAARAASRPRSAVARPGTPRCRGDTRLLQIRARAPEVAIVVLSGDAPAGAVLDAIERRCRIHPEDLAGRRHAGGLAQGSRRRRLPASRRSRRAPQPETPRPEAAPATADNLSA